MWKEGRCFRIDFGHKIFKNLARSWAGTTLANLLYTLLMSEVPAGAGEFLLEVPEGEQVVVCSGVGI